MMNEDYERLLRFSEFRENDAERKRNLIHDGLTTLRAFGINNAKIREDNRSLTFRRQGRTFVVYPRTWQFSVRSDNGYQRGRGAANLRKAILAERM